MGLYGFRAFGLYDSESVANVLSCLGRSVWKRTTKKSITACVNTVLQTGQTDRQDKTDRQTD